jgi:hypothetical protein
MNEEHKQKIEQAKVLIEQHNTDEAERLLSGISYVPEAQQLLMRISEGFYDTEDVDGPDVNR